MRLKKAVRRTSLKNLAVALSLCGPLLLSPPAWTQEDTPLVDSIAVEETLSAYEEQIAEIESRYGTYAPELIEVYAGMAEVLERSENWERLAEILQRQLQVSRTAHGFEDVRLIPLLNQLVALDIKMGNVNEVTSHLEHIRFVIGSNENTATDQLLQAITQQADWHLALVHYSNPEHRVSNFFKARELTEELLEIAEERYSEDDPDLIPWLYRDAVNKFQLIQFLNASNNIGYEAVEQLVRKEGPGKLAFRSASTAFSGTRTIPVLEEGKLIGEYYLRNALRNVDQIYDIAVNEENLEMQAMAILYRGDFKRLTGLASANKDYREAQELLAQAGVDPAEVESFFSLPAIIPNHQLHLTFSAAVAERTAMEAQLRSQYSAIIQDSDIVVGQFTSWNHSLDSSQMPIQKNQLLEVPSEFSEALVKLSINSRGSSYGRDSVVRIPDESSVGRIANRGISGISFRPRFEDGKAKRTRHVYMSYRFIPRQ